MKMSIRPGFIFEIIRYANSSKENAIALGYHVNSRDCTEDAIDFSEVDGQKMTKKRR